MDGHRNFLNEFNKRAFQLGPDISGTGQRNDFAIADKAKRNTDVALVKVWIEVASEMGGPVLGVLQGCNPRTKHGRIRPFGRRDGQRPKPWRHAQECR